MTKAAWMIASALLTGCVAESVADRSADEPRVSPASAQLYTAIAAAPDPAAEPRPYPCPTPTCRCRASDEIGDLLCKVKPGSNVISACDTKDIEGHPGQPGGACNGFGLRTVGNDTQYLPKAGTIESCYPEIDAADPSCKLMHDTKCAVKKCDGDPLTRRQQRRVGRQDLAATRCAMLGTIKHACVEKALKDDPNARVERSFDMSQSPPKVVKDSRGKETVGYWAGSSAAKKQGLAGPIKRPDIVTREPGPLDVLDAKFPCPEDVRTNTMGAGLTHRSSPRSGASMMEGTQRADYQRITQGGSVTPISPDDAKGEVCR
jgi:hypothetical protein